MRNRPKPTRDWFLVSANWALDTGKVEKFTAHVNYNLHYVNLSLHVLKILIYKVSTCKT